jgi:SAM-dependent methyltransferase
MNDINFDDQLVKNQYENYPYPERKPEDEKNRLITGSPSNLSEVNHYVFGGRRDLSKPLSVLVAGGGTGDAAILMAQQMIDFGVPGEVVHLDQSDSSQMIAKERAKVRGLGNIRFVKGSLFDVSKIAPGPWDYIDCCGVLHHLDDPSAGLSSLTEVLAIGGGLGLMVYGELGRIGVYHVQEMMSKLAPTGKIDDLQRISITKRLMASLPATAWFNRNSQIVDHKNGGDAGIFDLFLHARDKPYRVNDVVELVANANLRLVSFIEPYRYEPLLFVRDPKLKKIITELSYIEKAAFAETYLGNIKKHIFYAVNKENNINLPKAESGNVIPVLVNHTPEEIAKQMPTGGNISVVSDGHKIDMYVPSLSHAIVALCDGRRDLFSIHNVIRQKRSDLDYEEFINQFNRLYSVMNSINRMVLRMPIS